MLANVLMLCTTNAVAEIVNELAGLRGNRLLGLGPFKLLIKVSDLTSAS